MERSIGSCLKNSSLGVLGQVKSLCSNISQMKGSIYQSLLTSLLVLSPHFSGYFLNFVDSMKNSLLCTNQVRCNDIVVNDVPKICDEDSMQAIHHLCTDMKLPLEIHGPVPYLRIFKPDDS